MLVDAVLRNIPKIIDIPTVILGADVAHPPPREYSSALIAAVLFFLRENLFLLSIKLCIILFGSFNLKLLPLWIGLK